MAGEKKKEPIRDAGKYIDENWDNPLTFDMPHEEKIKIFKTELGFIKSKDIKEFATQALKIVPDYFFDAPASSSGNYHPKFAREEGGLVEHTRAAVWMAYELARTILWNLSNHQRDLVITTLILHDAYKSGFYPEDGTIVEHPIIIAEVLKRNEELKSIISEEDFNTIIGCISSHMGGWNTAYRSTEEVLPKPEMGNKLQQLVHECDVIVSRKFFHFDSTESVSKN